MCVIIGYNDKTINELKPGVQFATLCVTLLRFSFHGFVLSVSSFFSVLLYYEVIQNTSICNQLFSLFKGRLFLNQQSKVHSGIHFLLTQWLKIMFVPQFLSEISLTLCITDNKTQIISRNSVDVKNANLKLLIIKHSNMSFFFIKNLCLL